MSQEDKKLLLTDLCARLPYGVKVYAGEDLAMTLKQIDYKGFCESWENEDFKCHSRWMFPYLRPMSSMTDDEENEWCGLNIDPLLEAVKEKHTRIEDLMLRAKSIYNPLDWLNAHHFDYRGLIERGLAIAVTEENNPYKE
jgi:hypothetical protein